MPATVECDVLPSVDVDRSGTEHLDPGQQDELTDELAACFSEEPVLCRVRGIWLLFVFLVCGVVVLSMIVCLASDVVVFGMVVWHRCCVILEAGEYTVFIAVCNRM